MIPKLFCFIFGHIRTFHGDVNYLPENDDYSYRVFSYEECPRCGKQLPKTTGGKE